MDTTDRALRINRVNLPHQPGKSHTPEKKIEVVTKYLALGNLRLVSELTGVGYQLIRAWKGTDWWKDLEKEIRASRDIVVDNKLARIVDKSLEHIQDRLENGDVFYNRVTGEIDRKPVTLTASLKAAEVALTQQTLLAKKEQQADSAAQAATIQDTLKQLALQFAQFQNNRTVEVQARDVTDAVYDQRETRLQEAVREVRFAPGADQGTDGEESGPSSDAESGSGSQGGWEGRGSLTASEQGGLDEPLELEGSEQDDQSFFQPQLGR